MELLQSQLHELRCIRYALDLAAEALNLLASPHTPTAANLADELGAVLVDFDQFLIRETMERNSCLNGANDPTTPATTPSSESSARPPAAGSTD